MIFVPSSTTVSSFTKPILWASHRGRPAAQTMIPAAIVSSVSRETSKMIGLSEMVRAVTGNGPCAQGENAWARAG